MRSLQCRPGVAARPLALFALCALAGCAPAPPPPSGPIALPINLLCTTCDDFLSCERGVPGGRIVYRLEAKSFWGQVATIGDYLLQHVRPKTQDERAASIYRGEGAQRRIEHGLTAHIDTVAHTIELAGVRIDQRSGDWFDADGSRLGQCTAMTRRAGFAMVREFLGRAPVGAAP
jgi:hypothetical protein